MRKFILIRGNLSQVTEFGDVFQRYFRTDWFKVSQFLNRVSGSFKDNSDIINFTTHCDNIRMGFS